MFYFSLVLVLGIRPLNFVPSPALDLTNFGGSGADLAESEVDLRPNEPTYLVLESPSLKLKLKLKLDDILAGFWYYIDDSTNN